MHHFARTLSSAAFLIPLAICSPSQAEVRNPFVEQPGMQVLLAAPDVRQTLKLTEAQVAAVDAATTLELKLKAISESQRRQLKIIDAQREGGYVLTHDRVAKFLALTNEQKAKVAAAVEQNAGEHKKMKSFMARARFRSQQALEEYVAGYRDKADALLMDVLQPEQKQKLKNLFAGNAGD